MHGLQQHQTPLHMSSRRPCHVHHQKQSTTGPCTPIQDVNVNLTIITLLEFCLKIPTSSSRVSILNKSVVQPFVLPSATILQTCSGKSLKQKPSTLPLSPRLWCRYVDDTLIIQPVEHSHQFLQHINSIDPNIQFSTENPKDDGSIPFLDNLVSPGPNNTLIMSVYRKPTHTDQYLYRDRNP